MVNAGIGCNYCFKPLGLRLSLVKKKRLYWLSQAMFRLFYLCKSKLILKQYQQNSLRYCNYRHGKCCIGRRSLLSPKIYLQCILGRRLEPAKKGKPLPPAPPVAPPAPFAYMGKIEDSPKGTLIFLMANNKVYSVALGEKIDSFWRLDAEDAQKLTLTYLPLNLRQTLSKAQKLISAGLPNAAADAVN